MKSFTGVRWIQIGIFLVFCLCIVAIICYVFFYSSKTDISNEEVSPIETVTSIDILTWTTDSFADANIDIVFEDVPIDDAEVYEYEKTNIVELISIDNNSLSSEVQQAFSNINFNIENGINQIFPSEIPLAISRTLLFQFADSEEACREVSLLTTLHTQETLEECLFEYHLRQSLESQGKHVVPENFRNQNEIFSYISSQSCDVDKNFTCISLFPWKAWYLSREETLSLEESWIVENNSKLEDIWVQYYGYLVFEKDISEIAAWKELLDQFYDASTILRSVYQNDINICNDLVYLTNQTYCRDLFDISKKEKYRTLFLELYKGFYPEA